MCLTGRPDDDPSRGLSLAARKPGTHAAVTIRAQHAAAHRTARLLDVVCNPRGAGRVAPAGGEALD